MSKVQLGPETLRAFLVNAEGNWTLHRYVRAERKRWAGSKGSVSEDGVAFIFRCAETGAERIWGME